MDEKRGPERIRRELEDWERNQLDPVLSESPERKKRFTLSGGEEVQIEVTHPEYQTKTVTISELEEGTTVNLGIITVER